MNRAERRRSGAQKERTYTLTESQIQTIKQEAHDKAVDTVFTLMLGLPTAVLIGDGYWEKTAKKRIPKFLNDVLSLYETWQRGLLTIEELRAELLEYGGIDLEVNKRVEHF